MKKIFKIIVILLISLIIAGQLNCVYSTDSDFGQIISIGDDFIKEGKESLKDDEGAEIVKDMDQDKLRTSASQIYNILFTVGVIITVIVGGILGIKFMMASAEDKAQIKEMMIPYVVGCAVIYGAFGIWGVVLSVIEKF